MEIHKSISIMIIHNCYVAAQSLWLSVIGSGDYTDLL